MIGTGRRRLAPLLLMATLASAARAETQLYDVMLGSLRVGVLELMTEGDSARLSIQSAGLAGLVRAVRFEAEVSGTDPRRYEETADTGRRISQVRIEWQNDGPQVLHYAATPPETAPPPDAGATRGTLDPVSALVAVLGDTRKDDACRLSLHLFDGQRLSRLDLTGRDDTPGGAFLHRRLYPAARLSSRRHGRTPPLRTSGDLSHRRNGRPDGERGRGADALWKAAAETAIRAA